MTLIKFKNEKDLNWLLIFCLALFFYSCNLVSGNSDPKKYSISGTVSVLSEDSYVPIEGAIIEISGKIDTTSENGNYQIEGLLEGNYKVKILHLDFDTAYVAVIIGGENLVIQQDLRVTLSGYTLSGTISTLVEKEVMILEDVEVLVNGEKELTNHEGKYLFSGLIGGTHLIQLVYADLDTLEESINLHGSEMDIKKNLTISLKKKGNISASGKIAYRFREGNDGDLGVSYLDIKSVKGVKIDVYDVINGMDLYVKTEYTKEPFGDGGDLNYRIDSLNERTKKFRISHEYIESEVVTIEYPYLNNCDGFTHGCAGYVQLILVTSNTLADYLPLQIGNKWSYDYLLASNFANSWDSYKGTVEWKIVSEVKEGEKVIYTLEEEFNGYYTYRGNDCGALLVDGLPEGDTLRISNEVNTFTITEMFDGKLEFDSYPTRQPNCDIAAVSEEEMVRYYSPILGDSIQTRIGYDRYPIIFVKGVGIQTYTGPDDVFFTAHHRSFLRLNLFDFTVND